jgi:hypothetical protein
MTPTDRFWYRRLAFIENYYDCRLKFLTLTYPDGRYASRQDLYLLIRKLRKITDIEYMAVRTGEHKGYGVYHLLVISDYIDFALLQETWESITGAWGVHISQVKNMSKMMHELTRQDATIQYSKSKNLLPHGNITLDHALDTLKSLFTPTLRKKAYKMLAIRSRQKKGDLDQALHITISCIGRSPIGLCSDIRTHETLNIHHRQHASGATYPKELSRV